MTSIFIKLNFSISVGNYVFIILFYNRRIYNLLYDIGILVLNFYFRSRDKKRIHIEI